NAHDGFELVRTGSADEILFTVHGDAGKLAIVGGTSQGVLLETEDGALVDRTPENAPLLQGVFVEPDGATCAVGLGGSIYEGRGDGYRPIDPGLDFAAGASLHSVWVDEKGGVWSAGGDVLTAELDQGVLVHRGARVPDFVVEPPPTPEPTCPADAVD